MAFENTYTGNGSTTTYSFTFEYLLAAHVKVTLDGVATTAFTFPTVTSVQFNTAPANGSTIRIFRDTPVDTLQATFFAGSTIAADDLNNNFSQVLYVSEESEGLADATKVIANSAVTTANGAVTTANGAVTTANGAVTTANSSVSTANSANTKSDAAVATANTAETNSNTAVTTSNTASTNATAAVNTANTASTNATAAVNTANTASTNATNAVTTANSAASDAASAISTANTASTNASAAVTTANTASTTASTAVTTANGAVTTANTADTNATAAVATANAAQTAVAGAAFYSPVANVASIPASPSDQDRVEVADSTGIQNFTPLTGYPSGFTGSSGLTARIQFSSSGSTWNWVNYFANDPENRYLTDIIIDTTPQLGGDLDVNGNKIVTVSNGDIVIDPNGTGAVKIGDTSGGALSSYIALTDGAIEHVGYGDLDIEAGSGSINVKSFISSNLNTDVDIYPRGTGNVNFDPLSIGGTRLVGIDDPTAAQDAATKNYVDTTVAGIAADQIIEGNTSASVVDTGTDGHFKVITEGSENFRIASTGHVGIGTDNPSRNLVVNNSSGNAFIAVRGLDTGLAGILLGDQTDDTSGQISYSNSADSMQFLTASSEKMRITSGGNVGIGTTSPDYKLTIDSTNAYEAITAKLAEGSDGNFELVAANGPSSNTSGTEVSRFGINYNGTGWNSYFSFVRGTGQQLGSIAFATSQSERMRIDSSGNVGIGTTSPASRLTIGGSPNSANYISFGDRVAAAESNKPLIGQTSVDGSSNDLGLCATSSSGNILFYTGSGEGGFGADSNTERIRINSDGDVLLGQNTESRPGNGNTVKGAAFEKTTNGMKLYLSQNSGTAFNANRNNDGTLIDLRRSGSQVGRINVTSSAASYLTNSDYRLKENVVVLDGAISRVKQLLPKRFNFVQTPNETVDGFIAHEAQSVVPESVSGVQDGMQDEEYEVTPPVLDEDGNVTEEAVMGTRSVPDYQGIDQAKLVPLLTAALQEAITKIETLETKVAVLEAAT